MNLYAYAGNDPVSYDDPFGLCPEWMSKKDDGGGDCDYNGDGTVQPSEIAAHKSATASSSLASLGWSILGVFNTIIESPRGEAALNGVLSMGGGEEEGPAGRTAGGRATDEHGNPIGPSGKPQVDRVEHSTRKAAKDAARQEGKGAPVNHPSPTRGNKHFHPTDSEGKKLPGSTHHEYP